MMDLILPKLKPSISKGGHSLVYLFFEHLIIPSLRGDKTSRGVFGLIISYLPKRL